MNKSMTQSIKFTFNNTKIKCLIKKKIYYKDEL